MEIFFYGGIFSTRKDKHPIVTTEDGREWLVGSGSEDLLKSGVIKDGQKVVIHNRESEPMEIRTDNYCNITCPSCGRTHA